MEVVSYDGGFPLTSRGPRVKNELSLSALSVSSTSSSSSSSSLAISTNSFRALQSHLEVGDQRPSIRVSDSAVVEAVELEAGPASCAVLRGTASDSEPEVVNHHTGPKVVADVAAPRSPTCCSQQAWVFFDNRSSAAATGDQLLAEIASGSGRRVVSDENSGVRCRRHGPWQALGFLQRRFYECLRSKAADWLGLSGQLRLMTQRPPSRRSSKSRLARSRSRASNISAAGQQRSSSYKLARPDSRDFRCGPELVEERNAQMVTSSSRLSESTCTELSLFSLSALAASCPTEDHDDVHRGEISREPTTDRRETGYVADTEPEATAARYHGNGGRSFRWSRDRSDQSEDNSTSGRRIELPAAASTSRRLHMRPRHIPDSTLLRRSMSAAVVIASCTVSFCSLQIYAALGIYGVLSNEQVVKSLWAWLVFQSLNRCVGLVIYAAFHWDRELVFTRSGNW